MVFRFASIYGSAGLWQTILDKPIDYSIMNIKQNLPGFKSPYLDILLVRVYSWFDMSHRASHWVILLVCSGHSFSGGKGEICGSGATLGTGLVVGFTSGLVTAGMADLLLWIFRFST